MKRLPFALALALTPVLALAQAALPGVDADPAVIIDTLLKLVTAGHFAGAGVAAFILAVRLGRPLLVAKVPFFATDQGGTLLTSVVAPATILAGMFAAGTPVTPAVALGTFAFSLLSSETYSVLRRLVLQVAVKHLVPVLQEKGGVWSIAARFIERPLGFALDTLRSVIQKKTAPTASIESALTAEDRAGAKVIRLDVEPVEGGVEIQSNAQATLDDPSSGKG